MSSVKLTRGLEILFASWPTKGNKFTPCCIDVFLALDQAWTFCRLCSLEVPLMGSCWSRQALDRIPWAFGFWPQAPETRLFLLQVSFSALLHSMWLALVAKNRRQEARENQSISKRQALTMPRLLYNARGTMPLLGMDLASVDWTVARRRRQCLQQQNTWAGGAWGDAEGITTTAATATAAAVISSYCYYYSSNCY